MALLKNLTVGKKIALGFAVVLVLLAGICTLYQTAVQTATDTFDNLMAADGRIADAAAATEVDLLQCRRNEKDFLIRLDKKYAKKHEESIASLKKQLTTIVDVTQEAGRTEASQKVRQLLKTADEYSTAFQDIVAAWEVRGLDHKSGAQGEFRNAAQGIQEVAKQSGNDSILALILEIRKHEKDYLLRGDVKYMDKADETLAKLGKALESSGMTPDHLKHAKRLLEKYSQDFDRLVAQDATIAKLNSHMRAKAHEIDEQVTELYHKSNEAMAAATEQAKATMTKARTFGKISLVGAIAAVLGGCAVAFLLAHNIVTVLKQVVASLTSGSDQVASASAMIASSSQSLAQGTSEQAASVEETSSSIEEMSSMIKQNADNAQEGRSLSTSALSSAQKGTSSMTRMQKAIDDIKASADETSKIVKTIDEIAFQTNLLALNAAVEAARAGEAGKGFAVVAEEVRNLAQRSAEAARNTSSLISESVQNADNGVGISREVADTLTEIADGSGKVNDLVAEIAAACQEQTQGIQQINNAISQMDQVTQANAANAEESASAGEELSAQAEELTQVVGVLQKLIGQVEHRATAAGSQFVTDSQSPGKAPKAKPQTSGSLKTESTTQTDASLSSF